MPRSSKSKIVHVPFHVDSKCLIKIMNRAKSRGCSLEEYLDSFFLNGGVDAMTVRPARPLPRRSRA